jgi:demethylspheroidene O-methyltransferase
VNIPERASDGLAAVGGRADGLRGRWLDLRDRLLSSRHFQRWAGRFPLSRPIARRRSRELFDLTAGFVYSQVLFACVELDLFERLRAGPRSTVDLAEATRLPLAGADRLLRAAASLRLLQRRGPDLYGLGILGAAVLGNPGIGAMIDHHSRLYADLRHPVALLRGRRDTALAGYWPYAAAERPADLAEAQVGDYSALMAVSQSFIADEVLDAYSLKRHRRLLDLAGGEGVFALAAAERWPHLTATVFDLPAVVERAKPRFARSGLAQRLHAVGGDLFHAQLPEGADLVSLVRVLHDHDQAAARRILRAARRALAGGGTLIVAEPMSETPGAEPVGDAYFGFYLMAMGSGRPRTAAALGALLLEAGFRRIRELKTAQPMLVRVLVAEVDPAYVQ